MKTDHQPGWIGAFTRDNAPGALPGGTRIVKCNSEAGDGTPDGTLGIVLGSISHPEVMSGALFYFVEWANALRVAVGCMGYKVKQVPGG